MNLTAIERPTGKSEDYQFVTNDDTGRRYKIKHELRTAANGQPAIAISVSVVDRQHKAARKGNGEPDISYLTHTLTKVELEDPAFDPEARVAAMIEAAIEAKENEIGAAAAVRSLSARWAGQKPLDLTRRP